MKKREEATIVPCCRPLERKRHHSLGPNTQYFSQKFVGFVADCSDSAAAAPRREADDVQVRRHRLPLAVGRRRRFILIIQSPEYIIIIVKIVSTRVKAL